LAGGSIAAAMAAPDTYFCYACLRRHQTASVTGRGHRRFDIDADASTSAVQAHIREFDLQTKGVDAAFRILGFRGVEIHPPRFRRVQWAVEVLRRYRPPEEYRADRDPR